ncbi:MAG: PilZ domain-containing protein [Candidatus Electrothrix sp. YB6]
MTKHIERRKHPRIKLTGYTADITDGSIVYTATVQDASFEGVLLNDLPKRFATTVKGEQFSIIVSGYTDSTHYKFKVHSCWQQQDAFSVMVGFNIVNAPASWKALIRQELPMEEQDNQEENQEEEIWDQYVSARV